MRNKYNSNDSLFSLEYKIPYEKSSIEQHLQESQQQINYIKIKLTQAYEKLQNQIRNNTQLQQQTQFLAKKAKEIQEKYHYEKKQNIKLKQTLEVILKNRKIMQEEMQQAKQLGMKKIAEKDATIEQLQKQIKQLNSKCTSFVSQIEEKSRIIRQYSDRLRDQSLYKEHDSQKQLALTKKIQILEQEIQKITQQKYIEVNRLRHELLLYQRNATPVKQFKPQEKKQQKRQQRRREFTRPVPTSKLAPKFDTKTSQESEIEFNKQNVHSLQLNMVNSSFQGGSISKWKRPQSVKESQAQSSTPIISFTEDQMLSQYQINRKRAEQQLCALQKIKRPTNQQRQKMARLQREIYHLDSDIAGLKRKIRRKY